MGIVCVRERESVFVGIWKHLLSEHVCIKACHARVVNRPLLVKRDGLVEQPDTEDSATRPAFAVRVIRRAARLNVPVLSEGVD